MKDRVAQLPFFWVSKVRATKVQERERFRGHGERIDRGGGGPKLDVREFKGVGIRGGRAILARTEEEENGQSHEIRGGKGGGVAGEHGH